MSERVYCVGENTGCDHEDKPTFKECSDCPYMTTVKPMTEQDELLLEITALVEQAWHNGAIDYASRPDDEERKAVLFFGSSKIEGDIPTIAKEILTKVKQHMELSND